MEIVSRNVIELKLDPKNARQHSPRNITAIKDSLSRFGQRKPIVITDDNTIVAGNGTWVAVKELGWATIDVIVFPGTEAEARAFAIADNRTAELAEWDMDQLLETLGELDDDLTVAAGWSMDEINALLTPAERGILADADDTDPTPPPIACDGTGGCVAVGGA